MKLHLQTLRSGQQERPTRSGQLAQVRIKGSMTAAPSWFGTEDAQLGPNHRTHHVGIGRRPHQVGVLLPQVQLHLVLSQHACRQRAKRASRQAAEAADRHLIENARMPGPQERRSRRTALTPPLTNLVMVALLRHNTSGSREEGSKEQESSFEHVFARADTHRRRRSTK